MASTILNPEPFVSILMLAYNRARYIKSAVESVLAQSYDHFELIVIDDGSTDETLAILATFHDTRIRIVTHKENKGLLVRRKESLTNARGDYVAVLDSDDAWEPRKLETQVAYMEGHPQCVLVGTWIERMNDAGVPLGVREYECTDAAIRNRFLWRNQFCHSSVLIRKSTLEKTQGYRFPLDEDLDLFLQLGMYGKMANIPEVLTRYRIHTSGQSADRRGMVQNVLAIIREHKRNYPGYLFAYLKYKIALFLASVRS